MKVPFLKAVRGIFSNIIERFRGINSKRTIQLELMIALISISLLLVTVINLFYFNKMNTFIDENVKAYNSEIIRQVGQKLDYLLNQVDICKKQLMATAVTSQLFSNYTMKSPGEKVEIARRIDEQLGILRRSFSWKCEMYLIGHEGQIFSTAGRIRMDNLLDRNWIKEAPQDYFSDVVVPTHDDDYSDINSIHNVVSFVKRITGYSKNNAIGIVQVDLYYDEIKSIIEGVNIGEDGYILVTDKNNNVIYSPDDTCLGKSIDNLSYKGFNSANTNGFTITKEMGNAFIVTHSLPWSSWRIVAFVPVSNILIKTREVKDLSILIMLALVALSVLLSYILSKGITRPVTRIIETMKRVGQGELDITVTSVKNKDLQSLADSFNIMLNKINLLMRNIIEKEKEKTAAELKALQTQINPHFLYNTLNTIKWITLMERPRTAAKAIMSLGRIMKFCYESFDNILPVKYELEFIKNYMDIQRLRYGEGIEIRYEIDEEVYECCILKFVLQPIVENAIIHGLAGKKFAGLIVIRGYTNSKNLIFEIEDNGVGLKENKKEKLTGLGIENVNSRIKLNFGENSGLQLIGGCSGGTLAVINMPFIRRTESISDV